jgi:hypothetical protein
MWNRKSPTEQTLEKRANLLRNSCWVLLLWACSWYLLSRLSLFFGRSLKDSTVDLMTISLIASILLVWRVSWQAHRKSRNTLVCEHCNALKSDDGDQTCQCGGQYFNLLEMKWTPPIPKNRPHPAESPNQLLSQHSS